MKYPYFATIPTSTVTLSDSIWLGSIYESIKSVKIIRIWWDFLQKNKQKIPFDTITQLLSSGKEIL